MNYHLRPLEERQLLDLVEERRQGIRTERVLRACARSYLIAPEVLGALAADPERIPDRFSASYLLAVASRIVRQVGVANAHGSDRHPISAAVDRLEVARQLHALGVEPGGVLLVHTSFRAVRPVEGGPAGLIAALRNALGPDGTLVMPAWGDDDDRPFDPFTTPSAADLGVVADTFWRLPGVERSGHQFAFAAAGPRAAQILGDPLPLPPHGPASPVGRVRDVDGQILLLGVGHDANTTLHLAEVLANVPYRVPKHLTVRGPSGEVVRIDYAENDHCCQRFALADAWLRDCGAQREGTVGQGWARLVRATDLVRIALEQLRRDPLIFLHPTGRCADCDEAWRSMRKSHVREERGGIQHS